MRRVLGAAVTGQNPGDLSTLEDEESLEELKGAFSRGSYLNKQ